jgi:hypothetical protein
MNIKIIIKKVMEKRKKLLESLAEERYAVKLRETRVHAR